MKKVLAIAVLGVFTLASCEKDYTCECVSSAQGMNIYRSSTITAKKKDAEEACSNKFTTPDGVTTTCTIK